jgi:hypothetical protein
VVCPLTVLMNINMNKIPSKAQIVQIELYGHSGRLEYGHPAHLTPSHGPATMHLQDSLDDQGTRYPSVPTLSGKVPM